MFISSRDSLLDPPDLQEVIDQLHPKCSLSSGRLPPLRFHRMRLTNYPFLDGMEIRMEFE